MITERSVQNIIENATIEDVVGDYVNLKKRGANMIGKRRQFCTICNGARGLLFS
jgi:hypothetical protein